MRGIYVARAAPPRIRRALSATFRLLAPCELSIMLRLPCFSCVALLLPALLLLWLGAGAGGGVDAAPAPTLGLLTLLGSSSNGTNVFTDILLNHVQAKINALEVLADLIAIAGSGGTTDGS